MGDEFHLGSGNWWDTPRTTPASISTTLNAIASFGSSIDSNTVDSAAANPNLQMMGLGTNWNQAILGEKNESSFRSMLQEDMSSNSTNFHQENWRHNSSEDSSVNEFKQMNLGFSLDQANSNDSTITSHNLAAGYQVDSAAAYGLLLSENQSQYENIRPMMNYSYQSSGYNTNPGDHLMPTWNKFPQFMKTSPSSNSTGSSNLQFTNSTPFWNASVNDNSRPRFFPPAFQNQIPAAPSFDEKPKRTSEVGDSGLSVKKNVAETSNKRSRGNETPSPLPAFKVRKEKMGDRITALQQLVSPFGKTDTASVLSEAFDYIKFLHEQVCVLSTPYMKSSVPIHRQQKNLDKSKEQDGPRQDLRTRGLCLVPISSTFPVTNETTVDFWTPTFGGSFR